MNRRLRFALPLVLALLLVGGVAMAQPTSYDSGIQVQNLESSLANIVITFYNQDGTTAAVVNDTVDADGSNTYFPLENMGPGQVDLASGFDGSATISADKQVAAIVNVVADSLAFGASYSGFSGGAGTASLPLLMFDNFDFNTWFNVQNVGASPTNLTVNYSDGTMATKLNVQPGAAARFDQRTESHANGWVGSGTVTSSAGDIVATVIEEGTTTLFAYDGFTGGSTMPVMPIFQANNFGFISGIQIQNTSSSTATTVTVDYTPDTSGTACSETRTIAASASATFGLYVFTNFNDPDPGSLVSENCNVEQFVGAASVTANSAGTDLVVLVNQLNSGTNKGAAYGGFDPSLGTNRVVMPLIMDRNFGYFTGWGIFNTGAALNAGDVVCNVTGTDVNNNPFSTVVSNPNALPTGTGWTEVNLNTITNGFVGSASCTGTGSSSLVAIVNELSTGSAGDTFLVYEAFNN